MAYRDYQAPGVNVIIQRQEAQDVTQLTEFYPVFVGNGMTSRSRTVSESNIKVNTSDFPNVMLEWKISGAFNSQIFRETDFVVQKVSLHKEVVSGTPITKLVEGTDYSVVTPAALLQNESKARTTIKILDTEKIKATDLIYDIEVKIDNTDDDFDLRLISIEDRYYSKDIFGPLELVENDKSFFNDISFAAEIAFRMNVEKFFYLEVPREYGATATTEDFVAALEKVYYKTNAYRVVVLSLDTKVVEAVNNLTTSLSNPIDRREIVGLVSLDPTEITNMKDIDELTEKVGGFSESLNNKRICNVFGGESVELVVSAKRYVLPMYFMNVAIMCLDAVVGMGDPLSLRTINVFSKLNGPRLRPRQWDMLAKMGVFIVKQDDASEPITIRHQLTTAQSSAAEDQEYSIVKNFDAVTKRLRDRLAPYAGQSNITDGYLERLDGSLTSGIEEVKELGWARELTVVTPWALRKIGTGETAAEEKRNLISQLKLTPVYPANNLDLYLLV